MEAKKDKDVEFCTLSTFQIVHCVGREKGLGLYNIQRVD